MKNDFNKQSKLTALFVRRKELITLIALNKSRGPTQLSPVINNHIHKSEKCDSDYRFKTGKKYLIRLHILLVLSQIDDAFNILQSGNSTVNCLLNLPFDISFPYLLLTVSKRYKNVNVTPSYK